MVVKNYVTARIAALGNAITGTDVTCSWADNKTRRLTGILNSDTTSNCRTRVVHAGQLIAELSDTVFSATGGFVPVNQDYLPQEEFHIDINNLTAGVLNMDVTLQFEV